MSNTEHIGFNPNDYADQGNHRAQDAAVYGGTSRVTTVRAKDQHAFDEANAAVARAGQSAGPTTRVVSGSLTYSSGVVTEASAAGDSRHVHSSAGTPGGNILATIQRAGAQESIEIDGMRTSTASAARQGLIRRNAAGQWEVPGANEPLTGAQQAKADSDELARLNQPQESETPADPSAGAFLASEDADWAADIEPLPQHAYDGAIATMTNVVAHGTLTIDDAATRLAKSAGIAPTLAKDYVEQGYAMHERVVARAVAEHVPAEHLQEFYAATRMQPGKLQEAIGKLVHGRDVSGFKSMAAQFAASNPDRATKKAGTSAPAAPAAAPASPKPEPRRRSPSTTSGDDLTT